MIRVYKVRRRGGGTDGAAAGGVGGIRPGTRLFLSEQEIRRLRSYVPQALAGVDIC